MRRLLIAFMLLLFLFSPCWGGDISELSEISRQGYIRQQENLQSIAESLGTILRERDQRRIEREALEFFEAGVTMEKIQEFSQKYPNMPLADIIALARQIDSMRKYRDR